MNGGKYLVFILVNSRLKKSFVIFVKSNPIIFPLCAIPLFLEPKITSQANVRNTPSISKKVYFYKALCKADVSIVA